ncbi:MULTISPECIES: YciC family protein [unclassified Caulobacter]|uniref:YciC family protein n=1 Tax=unclassified Caulobacter TaxID=2648921 RepID=UPI0006F47A5A|nr:MULTISPECIES: YciC family protein [unclassified Caulobacter]KQV55674.1 hypothetical protein ASC62_17195 [Caulobacter sp. Root342]KQV71155.1 hypothetical protein ASC70_06060 [Caulobacter sp. Root343]
MTTLDAVGGTFDFGRVVQRTFQVIGQNLGLFALCALVLVVAPAFIGTLIGLKTQLAEQAFSPASLLGGLAAGVGGLILQGMVVHTVVARLNGRSVPFGDSLRAGARFMLPLLGLGIVQTLGVMVGFVLLFVPGLILAVMWAVSAPSMVVEERGVFESLQRSRDLTRGHRWSIFGLLVVYTILSMIVGGVVAGVGFAAGMSGVRGVPAGPLTTYTPMVVISTFLSSLTNGFQGVLVAAGAASIYYELRTTKEGVAPEQMASVFD